MTGVRVAGGRRDWLSWPASCSTAWRAASSALSAWAMPGELAASAGAGGSWARGVFGFPRAGELGVALATQRVKAARGQRFEASWPPGCHPPAAAGPGGGLRRIQRGQAEALEQRGLTVAEFGRGAAQGRQIEPAGGNGKAAQAGQLDERGVHKLALTAARHGFVTDPDRLPRVGQSAGGWRRRPAGCGFRPAGAAARAGWRHQESAISALAACFAVRAGWH